MPCAAACSDERADDVVGLEALGAVHGDVEGLHHLEAALDLLADVPGVLDRLQRALRCRVQRLADDAGASPPSSTHLGLDLLAVSAP